MAFLKFTPTASAYTAAAHIRAGAIISVDERADGRGGRVQTAAGAYDVTETPEQILAAIAETEGAPADGAFEEARDHLGAALKQVVPSDDQIIVGHIRSAHSLLVAALRARRTS